MKQIFFIPPTSKMELSEYGTNNLFVLGQHFLSNKEYKEYVLDAKKKGRFIILDNGMGDHGKFLNNDEILDIVSVLHPNEVIPTDNLYDKHNTIINAEDMIKKLKKYKFDNDTKVFMCPQGDTLEEWIDCYKWALNNDDVKTIGMSKKTIPHVILNVDNDEFIGEARNIMFDILRYRDLIKKDLHFLGSAGPNEYLHYKDCPFVRSTDSCVAIWQGMNYSKFDDLNYKRIKTPSNYFDLTINKGQMYDVIYNIEYFKKIVKLC